MNQFGRNNVWKPIPRLTTQSIIGTKWVFRNNLDEQGKIVRNKTRLVIEATMRKKELILVKLLL